MSCCFCGGDTSEANDSEYVEVKIRFPAFDGPMRQYFGAHVACFHRVASPSHRIENPFEFE
jgi:hypothetical protein